jgi:hypothetical protein
MIDIRLALAATAALGSGPIVFGRGFRHLRTCRLIENTPTARVRSMPMGLVEINGQVIPRSTVVAPFSGQSCAYWEVDVSVRGRRRGGWTVVHRNRSGHPFYLRDETGLALVYPHGADCRIRGGTDEDCLGLNLPACYADYLKQHPSVLTPVIRVSNLRFRERKLEEGQRVYVLGTAVPRSHEVVISEGDSLAATGTDDRHVARLRSLDAELDAVVRRGENEGTFLISQESERDLVLGLRWKALGLIVGGPALTLLGLGYWLDVLSAGWAPG